MKRILVLDDDRHILAILNELLSIDGYQVDIAYEANTALKFVDDFSPDLIITDILMPNMDGIEFIQKVRKKSAVPIVAMSGGRRAITPVNSILNKTTADLKLSTAMKVGANATLTKPFIRAQLQQTVSTMLCA